jgi:hypothetical protein
MKIKKFESYMKEGYFSYQDIEELFIDIIDIGYEFEIYEKRLEKIGKYFFGLKRSYDDEFLGYVEKGHVYGFNDLEKISNVISILLDNLNSIKDRIEHSGYSIAFELEFNFSISAMIAVSCHMQYSEYDDEEYDFL